MPIAGGKRIVDIMEIVHGQGDLLQPIQLLSSLCLLLCTLRHVFQTCRIHDEADFCDLLDLKPGVLLKFAQQTFQNLLTFSGFEQSLKPFRVDYARRLSRHDDQGVVGNVLQQCRFLRLSCRQRRCRFSARDSGLELTFRSSFLCCRLLLRQKRRSQRPEKKGQNQQIRFHLLQHRGRPCLIQKRK